MAASMSSDHNVLGEMTKRRLRFDAPLSYNLVTMLSSFGSEAWAHRSTLQVTACRACSIQICNVYNFTSVAIHNDSIEYPIFYLPW